MERSLKIFRTIKILNKNEHFFFKNYIYIIYNNIILYINYYTKYMVKSTVN